MFVLVKEKCERGSGKMQGDFLVLKQGGSVRLPIIGYYLVPSVRISKMQKIKLSIKFVVEYYNLMIK